MSKLETILTSAINLIGKEEVSALLEKIGYNTEATASNCLKAMKDCGDDFNIPFGQALKKAAQSPRARARYVAAARLLKGSGATATTEGEGKTASSMTAEQKADKGLAYIESISKLFIDGGDVVGKLGRTFNGTDKEIALADHTRETRLLEEQQQKKTLYWVLGGLGVILIVAIFIIALSKRS